MRSTRAALMACCLVLVTAVAAGPVALAEAQRGPELPDAAGVVEAYMMARQWLDAFDAPPLDDPASTLVIENASGICVILRGAGRVVGTGVATLGADSEPELMLRRAMGRAMSDVLGDSAIAAIPEDRRSDVGRTLTLELEVAGSLQPLLGRDFNRIAQQIEPGLDGVAMRRGDARAMLFPAQLRSVNAAGNIQPRLPGLAADIGLSPADLDVLQRRHSVSMHRFRTTHLAQEAPSRFPFETFRGDRLVGLHEVTVESIASFADGIASHLIGRLWVQPHRAADALNGEEFDLDLSMVEENDEGARLALGMIGDYNPITDSPRPVVAPPLDQALSAFALMRYSAAPGVDPATAEEARLAAVSLLVDLERVESGETDPASDPAACAAIVMTLAENAELAAKREAIDRLGRSAQRVIEGTFNKKSGFQAGGQLLAPHTQAMIAYAFTMHAANDNGTDTATVRAAIDAAWASVPHAQHVTLLPWIGWAEIQFADLTGEPIANAAALIDIKKSLREARALSEENLGADLIGGFPLAVGADPLRGEGGLGGLDRPTAQTSRPAALIATMLREPFLVPQAERPVAFEGHRQTMRFLMQLSVRDSNAWSFRNRQAAEGGVRASPWDARMPTGAQSLTLLAAIETLLSAR